MVRKRISALKLELEKVVVHREVQRKRRMKLPIPTCSIVGYTNAGKSSLLNHLTESDVLAEDKLFATLDPTSRRLEMPSGKLLIVTDTVGFVRNLPHKLINAFKATLEEAILANFLIHVLDVSSPEVEEHYNTTLEVLKELGADDIHRITVFNKIDLCEDRAYLGELKSQYKDALFVSSLTGEGNEELLKTIDALLINELIDVELLIPHDQYQYVSRLHDGGIISTQKHTDDGLILIGKFSPVISDIVKKFRI
jgi:GTP-binding protein HflX